jgi:hypothetical protein
MKSGSRWGRLGAAVGIIACAVSAAGCGASNGKAADTGTQAGHRSAKQAAAIKAGAWDKIGGEVPKDVEPVKTHVKRPEFDSTVTLNKPYVLVGTAYDDEDFDCRLYLHPTEATQKKQTCVYSGFWDGEDVTKGYRLGSSVPTSFNPTLRQAKSFFASGGDSFFYATRKKPVRIGDWVVYAAPHHKITFWNTKTGHGVYQRLGVEKRSNVKLATF